MGRQRLQFARGLSDHIFDHARDQAAHKLGYATRGLDARVLRGNFSKRFVDQRDLRNLFQAEQFGAQSVVNVVGVIGDVIGNGADLAFRAGVAPQFEIVQFRIFDDGAGHATFRIARNRPAILVGERAIVLDQTFERFPGKIKPIEVGVAPL